MKHQNLINSVAIFHVEGFPHDHQKSKNLTFLHFMHFVHCQWKQCKQWNITIILICVSSHLNHIVQQKPHRGNMLCLYKIRIIRTTQRWKPFVRYLIRNYHRVNVFSYYPELTHGEHFALNVLHYPKLTNGSWNFAAVNYYPSLFPS